VPEVDVDGGRTRAEHAVGAVDDGVLIVGGQGGSGAPATVLTLDERDRPRIINGSRRKRIASGSGTSVQEVNRLLKRFAQTQKLMKKLNKKGRRNNWANMPGF